MVRDAAITRHNKPWIKRNSFMTVIGCVCTFLGQLCLAVLWIIIINWWPQLARWQH